MRNTLLGGLVILLIFCQTVGVSNADSEVTMVPGAYFSYSFAAPKIPSQVRYGAQLSLDRRFNEPRRLGPVLEADSGAPPGLDLTRSIPYFQLDVKHGAAATMKLLGTDVAGYRYRLDETDTQGASPGWFSRNWGWVAATGVVVVGGIVAAASGGHGSDNSNSGVNNCTPSGPVTVGECGNGVQVTR